MTDSWSIPKPLALIAGIAAAITAVGGAWKLLDLPVPASRAWVQQTVAPYDDDSLMLLHVRRQLNLTELYQWESNPVMNDNIRLNIERLKGEIASIDRQIAQRSR